MEIEIIETLPLAKYDVNLAAIGKLREQYMPMVITDLEDREQFDAVHNGRMTMVKIRTSIDKQRKKNNETAREYIKDNDNAAKELLSESMPIEEHLQFEENKVIQERERIKAEEEAREKERVQSRVDALGKYKLMLPYFDVVAMTDEEFEAKLLQAKEMFEAEEAQLAKEKAEREAEEARIAAERAELARIREEQERQAQAQEAEKRALEAERAALEKAKREAEEEESRKIFEAQAKEEARIQAEKDAIAKQVAKEATEKAEEEEAIRLETLKPDKEKLIAWTKSIKEIMIPPLADKDIQILAAFALSDIHRIADEVEKKLEEL